MIDSIADCARRQGHLLRRAYPLSFRTLPRKEGDIIVCSRFENRLNQRLVRLTGLIGCFSALRTRRLIRRIKKFSPDIIHIHNIHSSFVNLRLLFRYIKKSGVRVIWTLHDCWGFTGKCAHFTAAGCDGWRRGCGGCPELREYPSIRPDRSAYLLKKKKEWFDGVPDMTLVTPSEWLADLARESFLGKYPIRVIHNGVDTSVFLPTEGDFRERYSVGERYLLLGVSLDWGERKGLGAFIELARRLGDGYRVALVGVDASTPSLPENVIAIERTSSREELAEIYTAADLFVNPTLEDTFPTVNLEALACGTPVLTYRTGGSAEMLTDSVGVSVERGDLDALEREVRRICTERPFTASDCVARAAEFSAEARFAEYVALYEEN